MALLLQTPHTQEGVCYTDQTFKIRPLLYYNNSSSLGIGGIEFDKVGDNQITIAIMKLTLTPSFHYNCT
ncbi:hypothetical protein CCACVL1_15067 [Corchorus capsularis]|uniref:Uncharacterized protein n=1 Tax=Corchorus capsularis TaxID=210143 RepID=A0A1R3I414_COCAP|nr:hypothetical protein CCACVL1_15067 [Corchorus capsularis]